MGNNQSSNVPTNAGAGSVRCYIGEENCFLINSGCEGDYLNGPKLCCTAAKKGNKMTAGLYIMPFGEPKGDEKGDDLVMFNSQGTTIAKKVDTISTSYWLANSTISIYDLHNQDGSVSINGDRLGTAKVVQVGTGFVSWDGYGDFGYVDKAAFYFNIDPFAENGKPYVQVIAMGDMGCARKNLTLT
jgi:hypothetical protein